MEDRFHAMPAAEQRLFFVRLERLVILRHVHGQPEILLVSGRQRGGDGMAERPAQAQRCFIGERGRLIPALGLGMILFLFGRPHGLRHALQSQDAHLLFLRSF